ncbi:MAG TPA: menaquinone biosynthesis protein [Candidatus Kryptonia bacterium]
MSISNNPTSGKKKLGAVSFLNTKPLIYGLEKNLFPHNFDIRKDIPSALAVLLGAGQLDVALIPSIAYAKHSPILRVVPECGIIAHDKVNSIRLYFNKDLANIRKVALDISSMTSVVLTKVILAEKYEIKPEFVVAQPDVSRMLASADAALVIGDSALFKTGSAGPNYLDLAEEWVDMTGLPFVFAVWAGKPDALNVDDVHAIIYSKNLGIDNIETVCKEAAAEYGTSLNVILEYLTNNVQFNLGEAEIAGMRHFFELAYYHGALEYLPSLNFYPLETTAESASSS